MHDRRPRPGQALMSSGVSTTTMATGTSVVVLSSASAAVASTSTVGATTSSSSSASASKSSVSSAPSCCHRGGDHMLAVLGGGESDSSLGSTISVNNPSASASSSSSVVSASSSPAALGNGCASGEEQHAVGKKFVYFSSPSSPSSAHEPVTSRSRSRSNPPQSSPQHPRCSISRNNNTRRRRRDTSATKKSVTFPRQRAELLKVRETICLDDFSDEEYRSYWMSDAEQAMILDMVDMTTALWSMGAKEDLENHICYRGLEGKSEEAVEEYTERYLDLVSGILWAQENCRVAVEVQPSTAVSDSDAEYDTDDTWSTSDTAYYGATSDPESNSGAATNTNTDIEYQIDHEQIADLYRQCTTQCQEVAFQRAQVDEYDACMFYMESTATSSILQQLSHDGKYEDDDYDEKEQREDVYEEYEIDLEDDYTDSEEGHDDACTPNECE
mmetsp:Transcript_29526/g.71303  ORF Transcript_29526/g.71303 Transcript_29526/m.71303 type:complete len:443 (-) Transcript_29526:63-1391(-)